jgi:hypothetical protein
MQAKCMAKGLRSLIFSFMSRMPVTIVVSFYYGRITTLPPQPLYDILCQLLDKRSTATLPMWKKFEALNSQKCLGRSPGQILTLSEFGLENAMKLKGVPLDDQTGSPG